MLNSILNHPKLTREGVFSILLLPPATSNEPYDYDYLVYNAHGQCTHLVLYLEQDIDPAYHKHDHASSAQKTMMGQLRHKEGLLPKIDRLVLQFCETATHCDSLEALREGMKAIVQDGYGMIESVVNPTGREMYRAFESYVMEESYDVVFFRIAQELFEKDATLSRALKELGYLDFSQIGLPDYVREERRRVADALVIFEKIGSFRTPAEKLDCLLETVDGLTEGAWGTDALVPLLLMTLIRSKVPHLVANVVYMKEYQLERGVTGGRDGYALSTLEGVMDYVLSSDLAPLSLQNKRLWQIVRQGDLVRFQQHPGPLDVRDPEGNNALLLACRWGQTELVEHIRQRQGIGADDVNDAGMTPLMCAVQSRSHRLVRALLQDDQVLSTIQAVDREGHSVLFYLAATRDVDLLDPLWRAIRPQADARLHRAAAHPCPIEFLPYLLPLSQPASKAHDGHTVDPLHRDLLSRLDRPLILHDRDRFGPCPLMAWASQGRLDLVELFLDMPEVALVIHQGQTLLHCIAARLTRGLTLGEMDLESVVEHCRPLIHARDGRGQTALHVAASQSGPLAHTFIRAIHRFGGALDWMNLCGARPVDGCQHPDTTCVLEDLTLDTSRPTALSPTSRYAWAVTRASVKRGVKNGLDIQFVMTSEQIGRPGTIKRVKRRLEEFVEFRNELVNRWPERIFPTLHDLMDPSCVHLDPPSYLLINTILSRLQYFMDWLQHHPVLQHHALVLSFVRQQPKPSALVEKLEEPGLVWMTNTNSKDEAYFFRYIQDNILLLQRNYLNVLNRGRRLNNAKQDLQVQLSSTVSTFKPVFQDPMETIKVCAECHDATLEMMYDLMSGGVLTLERSLGLIDRRNTLWQSVECQKETIRKPKGAWSSLFSKEKKKVEQEKRRVIQMMRSHQILSDELAHFQQFHSKRLIQIIQQTVLNTLEVERYNLNLLIQSSNSFSSSFPTKQV
ncbi:hypothetical protein RO3G_06004 [Rhizopus delemar RA 99-880]|uniref:VPS9 domain-containing protein n=1 Tax=Rhizopus delemar (strain RA 99-880 / ATCC MYA-4621 / FGSC 9543 / NRRL 43880) TaxID=246409 RepID=I1BYL9_RHIO9|nr:hypothetical protein RO3G_06004 [Rhizopus delemar RA 99-880]|eukprot:EIE81299.1 hypothetical protein RO3G_06004 [Rhizopus delemar RA 99-880]